MQEVNQVEATFPERIYELAREHRVGVPIKGYQPAIFWWFIIASLAIVLFTMLLFIDIHDYTIHKTETQQSAQFYASCQSCSQEDKTLNSQTSASILSDDKQSILNEAEAIVSGLILIAFLLYVRQKLVLYRCSEGLFLSPSKRGTRSWRWNEIIDIYWSGNRICSLHKADDKQILDLMRFHNSQDVQEYIESEVTPRLFTQALEQYKRTGSVYFNALSIKHDGLVITRPSISWGNGKSIVLWQDLEDIRFADGVLSIKLQGEWKGWISSPRAQKRLARTIPNPTVYVALAKYLLENGRIAEKRIGE